MTVKAFDAFFLIALFTFIMKRVAESEKFTDAYLNSLTIEGKTKQKVAAKWIYDCCSIE